ncbi:MAG: S8 family serine peptidase [Promethearchaeota archaeon]
MNILFTGLIRNKKLSVSLVIMTLMLSSFALAGSGVLSSLNGQGSLQTEVNLTQVAASTPLEKLTTGVAGLLEQGATPVSVIVQTTTHDYAQLTSLIESLGGTVTYAFNNIEALAVTIPASALLDLAASSLVVRIYLDTERYLMSSKEIMPLERLMTEDLGIEVNLLDTRMMDAVPSTYTNPYLTKADQIWAEVNGGEGIRIAIIDTGCWDEEMRVVDGDYGPVGYLSWYYPAVYGGIDLSYDVGNSTYEGYGNPNNHWHGSGCAALIAAHVAIGFPEGHSWGESIYQWDPEGSTNVSGTKWVECWGIAPNAEIYAVKVFDHTGGGVPTSMVMAGIDAAIDEGVDVISMSLGGGCGAPGMAPEDLLVDAATELGITVVVAAGNEGPATLRVGSPGTAKSAITVGAAMDPIHERVFGSIVLSGYGFPYSYGYFYYPDEEFGIVDFSSRGPTSDGRVKPDVVATGSWTFFGSIPSDYPYTLWLAGGTSFSCPQVAGAAALLTAYIKMNGWDLGPKEIKEAIMEGADPIPGFADFEQGSGYLNCEDSLAVLADMAEDSNDCHCRGTGRFCFNWWYPPIETLRLRCGKTTIKDVTLDPGKYEYFAFWVSDQVDAIRITLSGVEFSENQNPLFGDAGVVYLSSAVREGVEDYLFAGYYFYGDAIIQVSSDFTFQPGLVRLVLSGDFSSYGPVSIEEITIEVVEVRALAHGGWLYISSYGCESVAADVCVYPGTIITAKGKIKEGELDIYSFTIPDEAGWAIVELSWKLDWTKWATSDLDLIIVGPEGYNVEGATGASPEVTTIVGPGDYTFLIDGYTVYFGRSEYYTLRIIYFADSEPIWCRSIYIHHWTGWVKIPKKVHGVAVVWVYDKLFDYYYMADYVKV